VAALQKNSSAFLRKSNHGGLFLKEEKTVSSADPVRGTPDRDGGLTAAEGEGGCAPAETTSSDETREGRKAGKKTTEGGKKIKS